jgi:uncharacterized protein YvpB
MKQCVLLLLLSQISYLTACSSQALRSVSTNDRESISVSGKTVFNGREEGNGRAASEVRLDVAYIPQNDTKSCATTSVAMIVSYYEHLDMPLDKEAVWAISGTDEAVVGQYGNDMEGLQRIATHYEYKSEYIENMEIQDVEHFLSSGMPVMLNITLDKQTTTTHAILVVGFNKSKNIFYINDPANAQNKILEYSDLTTKWFAYLSFPRKRSYRSGFVVYPKNY